MRKCICIFKLNKASFPRNLDIFLKTHFFYRINHSGNLFSQRNVASQGGLATAFDLAAFWLSMIAPVKKSVNHSRTVASMRETGWEKQQGAHLRSDSTVWSEFAFIILILSVIAFFRLCCSQFLSAVMWSLRFRFFWSCVCHYMRFTTLRTKLVNMFLDVRPFDYVFLFRRPTRLKKSLCFQVKGPKLILRDIKKSVLAVVE